MRTRVLACTFCLFCTLFLSGCYSVHMKTGAAPGPETHTVSNTHLLGGLISVDDSIPAHRLCPQGVAEIHQETTFVDGFLNGITFGLYTPTTTTIVCASGSSWKAAPGAAPVRVVHHP